MHLTTSVSGTFLKLHRYNQGSKLYWRSMMLRKTSRCCRILAFSKRSSKYTLEIKWLFLTIETNIKRRMVGHRKRWLQVIQAYQQENQPELFSLRTGIQTFSGSKSPMIFKYLKIHLPCANEFSKPSSKIKISPQKHQKNPNKPLKPLANFWSPNVSSNQRSWITLSHPLNSRSLLCSTSSSFRMCQKSPFNLRSLRGKCKIIF